MIFGTDISHHNDDDANGPINFDLLRGHVDFIISKLTEGTYYVDPSGTNHVAETRRIGAIPGVYHFARGTDANLEAGYFMAHCPDLTGAFVALDWEVSHPNPVAWSLTWLTAVRKAIGAAPLIYLNKSTLSAYDWSPVVNAGFGLWRANYDGNPSDFSGSGQWPCIALEQYSDSMFIPGDTAAYDGDSFNGAIDQLRAYCVPGTPTPTPVPVPAPPAPVSPWLGLPSLAYGMSNNNSVRSLQRFLINNFPAYAAKRGALTVTGNYLSVTTGWVLEFQQRTGITSGDGRNIGPQTKAQLWHYGWRG